jgi:hypothetical protein
VKVARSLALPLLLFVGSSCAGRDAAADPVDSAASCADLVQPLADLVNDFGSSPIDLPGFENIEVIAFLNDSMIPEDAATLAGEVEQWDGVRSVYFFSKDEALGEFRELFADQPELIQTVERDPSILPASLRVKPDATVDLRNIADRLRSSPGVMQVSSADAAIEAFAARLWLLRGSLRERHAELFDRAIALGCQLSEVAAAVETAGLVSRNTFTVWLMDGIRIGSLPG